MKTFVSRAVPAALLAMSLSATAALAQVSPADPNYSYDTRGKVVPWNVGSGYAQVPTARDHYRNGLSARAAVIGDNGYRGQDPDANIRLQMHRSQGLFDR